ncbi:MAG TPA: type VI secretion system tube protein Hcp [Longimicrobium sp.]|nr:type VI secretion system tube protein Hcp [Longimicrobium sp.]
MADNIFLNIPTIPGQTMQTGFAKQIECLSYSHGVSIQVTGDTSNSERTSGKPNHQDFHITKYVDSSTPLLNQNCCMGQNLGVTTITVGRNDTGAFLPILIYTLQNTVVSSVSVGGGGGDKPVETLSLNYSAIQWAYTVQNETGGKEGQVPGAWNVATNTTTVP